MKDLSVMLQETNPKRLVEYLDHYVVIMDMNRKFNIEDKELENEFLILREYCLDKVDNIDEY